jgi:hypothetical protein
MDVINPKTKGYLMIAAKRELLRFSPGGDNAKLIKLQTLTRRKLYTFSLVSGATCPYANECLAKVKIDKDGKRSIWRGPEMQHQCFSASMELIFPAVHDQRISNGTKVLELAARSWKAAADLIVESIPQDAQLIRIHVGGDFKTRSYFKAWCEALKQLPHIRGYAYTKSLPFWVLERDLGNIPQNLLLTASVGGKADKLIEKHNLRWSKVVFSVAQARREGLAIDHDDRHAAMEKYRNTNFSLLIHGKQAAGSPASKAVAALKGKGSYSSLKAA